MTCCSEYKKHFLPLESNPDVFNQLMYGLGVSSAVTFCDLLSIDDHDLLQLIPRPVHALVLVFPTPEDYEATRVRQAETGSQYDRCGEAEDVLWFKQTIGNACGLYGLLHAITNGKARAYIKDGSLLGGLMKEFSSRPPNERHILLENSTELEALYKSAATQGVSATPDSAEDEVDFHYVTFVRSHQTGNLYEMDGDKHGPVNLVISLGEAEDLLTERVLEVIRAFIRRYESNGGFSLMALVEKEVGSTS